MKNATKRSLVAKKAAVTRKRAAAKKAATTRKHRAAGRRAAATGKHRAAGKKSAATKKRNATSLAKIKLHMALVNDLFNTEVVQNRNIAALNDVYTSDARILPPGGPMISGREAIKNFWADWIQSVNPKSAVLISVDMMPSDDGVVEIGRATLTAEPPSQAPIQVEVKYVVYWKKEGGRWKWHVDIWNPNS
jgi:ketosteroid isomerase-like protein